MMNIPGCKKAAAPDRFDRFPHNDAYIFTLRPSGDLRSKFVFAGTSDSKMKSERRTESVRLFAGRQRDQHVVS